MIKRATFLAMPGEPERLAWCAWLRHHTVDPDAVLACCGDSRGFVEIDTCTYRIRFLTHNVNDRPDPFNRPCPALTEVQLESAPSDFPRIAYESLHTNVEVIQPCWS